MFFIRKIKIKIKHLSSLNQSLWANASLSFKKCWGSGSSLPKQRGPPPPA